MTPRSTRGGPAAVGSRRPWWRLTAGEQAALAAVVVARGLYFLAIQLLPLSKRLDLTPDARPYWRTARDIAAGVHVSAIDNSFPVIVGNLMRWLAIPVTAPFEFLGALAAGCTALLALWLCDLVRADGDGRGPAGAGTYDRRIVILAVGLYPSGVLFSSTGFIRDGWIYALSLGAVTLFAAGVWSGRRLRVAALLLAFLAVYVIVGLRAYAAVSLALGTGLWLLWERRVPVARWSLRLRGFGFACLGAAAAAYVVLRDHLDPRIRSLSAIADYRANYFASSSDASNMGIDFRNASPPQFARKYLTSFVGNVIGPLPNQVRSTVLAAFFLEAIGLVVMAVLLWRRRRLLGPRARFLVAQAFAWFALIAIFNDNLGTAARLRVPPWTWLLIALASVLRSRREPVRPPRARSVVVPLRPSAVRA